MKIAIASTSAAPAATGEPAQLRDVAKQFEAVFLRQLIGSMRQASLAEGALDSSATDQFRDMADARTADAMAATGGFGIAELLVRQFEAKAVPKKPLEPSTAAPAKAAPLPAVDTIR